jgi:hypothetical protein
VLIQADRSRKSLTSLVLDSLQGELEAIKVLDDL